MGGDPESAVRRPPACAPSWTCPAARAASPARSRARASRSSAATSRSRCCRRPPLDLAAGSGRQTTRHPWLRAGQRRTPAAAQRLARLRRVHPLHDARGSGDARADAARVRARFAPLGHRRLPSQVHVPLPGHPHGREVRLRSHAAVARVDERSHEEFRQAGLAIREIIRVSAPLLSDKWVVLSERA